MACPDGVVRVVAYMDEELVQQIDKISEEAGISRSRLVAACIEGGLEDLRFMSFIGLPPRRLQRVGTALEKFGIIATKHKNLDTPEIRRKERE